jgi:hypothetical protein
MHSSRGMPSEVRSAKLAAEAADVGREMTSGLKGRAVLP